MKIEIVIRRLHRPDEHAYAIETWRGPRRIASVEVVGDAVQALRVSRLVEITLDALGTPWVRTITTGEASS